MPEYSSDTAGQQPSSTRKQSAYQLRVDAEHAGRRIDNFLFSLLNNVPKSRVYRMLRGGEVRVNGKRAKPDMRLQQDDELRLPPLSAPRTETPAPRVQLQQIRQLAAAVLHEDNGLIVLNKPSGMAVHGGSGVNLGVIEGLRALYPQAKYLELAHRLDRDTSGCLMVAKKPSVLRALHEVLRNGGIGKHYQALVAGRWDAKQRRVDAPLQKHILRGGERMVSVAQDGKAAVTHFRVLRHYPESSLLAVELETGRTHQIRVHAAHCGHPLAGDEKYGDKAFNSQMKKLGLKRMFLHAERLQIPALLTREPLAVSAPLPQLLQDFLQLLETTR